MDHIVIVIIPKFPSVLIKYPSIYLSIYLSIYCSLPWIILLYEFLHCDRFQLNWHNCLTSLIEKGWKWLLFNFHSIVRPSLWCKVRNGLYLLVVKGHGNVFKGLWIVLSFEIRSVTMSGTPVFASRTCNWWPCLDVSVQRKVLGSQAGDKGDRHVSTESPVVLSQGKEKVVSISL